MSVWRTKSRLHLSRTGNLILATVKISQLESYYVILPNTTKKLFKRVFRGVTVTRASWSSAVYPDRPIACPPARPSVDRSTSRLIDDEGIGHTKRPELRGHSTSWERNTRRRTKYDTRAWSMSVSRSVGTWVCVAYRRSHTPIGQPSVGR